MWVARDKDRTLKIWITKPSRVSKDYNSKELCEWFTQNGYIVSSRSGENCIDQNLFPNLTWEDEPVEVNIIQKQINMTKEGATWRTER